MGVDKVWEAGSGEKWYILHHDWVTLGTTVPDSCAGLFETICLFYNYEKGVNLGPYFTLFVFLPGVDAFIAHSLKSVILLE